MCGYGVVATTILASKLTNKNGKKSLKEKFEFAKFYKVAKDQDTRERNFMAYCHYLPYMDKKTFISFEDYHRKCTGADIDKRPAEEIMAEVEAIRREMNGNIIV